MARSIGLLVACEFVARTALAESRVGCLRRQHSGLDGVMAAFDPRKIDEARGAADQRSSGKCKLWNRLESTLGDGPCAVADTFAALEELSDHRVVFHALEFVERRDVRVRVVEVNDEAHGAEIFAPVVHKESA